MDVSENSSTPKSSTLIGFSIIFTIHFGGNTPIFGKPPILGGKRQLARNSTPPNPENPRNGCFPLAPKSPQKRWQFLFKGNEALFLSQGSVCRFFRLTPLGFGLHSRLGRLCAA